MIDSLKNHFYVGPSFELSESLDIVEPENIGTLEKVSFKHKPNILTGLVRVSDSSCGKFENHAADLYIMESIPSSINFMDIEYFLPMVKGDIDGYYKVDKVYFGMSEGKQCLKLNLSTYIPLGAEWIRIYRVKMQPGELISYQIMIDLYQK